MNRRLTLASSVAGAVLVALDGTVLTVAQPSLQRALHASFAQVQWTSTAYLVAVASLLVFAGRLGDRYGQRRMFALGMLGFGAASAGIGLAPGIGWVIGLRVAQGVFGALLQPATLGMLRAAFPPDRLAMPLAVRTSAIGLAAAAGPLVGGALVTGLGWRAVFFLGVLPATAFGLAALTGTNRAPLTDTNRAPLTGTDPTPVTGTDPTPMTAPDRTKAAALAEDPRPSLDLPGALLLAVALACFVHTLVALPGSGVATAAGLGGAALAGGAFVRHERRAASPLLPPEVIGSPAVGAALALLVAVSASLFGTLFVETYVLQRRLGLDPFHSALRSLPLAVLMVLSAPLCPVLLRRAGARWTAGAATAVLALGVLVLSRATGTLALGAGFALLGAGFGTVMVAATHVVVRRADVAVAGVAGGLQQTALNVGPVVGVAAGTALMGAEPRAALLVLAAVAACAVPVARALPGRGVASITPTPDERAGAGVPARR
ncbi:MFS transporter [Streptomyces cellostaticus]|uniref:MFS transporter n=1 Tax=Streptomyces cellostaticus TaxID=67285 RepID=A0A101NT06_9ACTN|nr:MFS transporter [Streptomyces cellostaticus]KUM98537.1 MFS transporter [Streptomyces cellostaticus]GHI03057.1 MFS transporter [Streptomyces cellostaticus]